MKSKSLSLALVTVCLPWCALADVTPSALFTDNMVIQRHTHAPVWGTADAGEEVSVTGSWGGAAVTTADNEGKWMVKLSTPPEPGPHTITIKGNNTIEIKNVLAGEVWFCSGQSNMDFSLLHLAGPHPKRTTPEHVPAAEYVKKEMETAQDDLLRQFTVARTTSPLKPLNTLASAWIISSPENNPNFSATAYFFGRELREALKVPVGLIECAWGGTRIEPWIPAEEFRKDEDMAAYLESNLVRLKEWDPEKANAAYQAALEEIKASGKRRRPKAPRSPAEDQQFPSTLFNGMVNPVIPYAIKGALWYQGESNARHNTLKYEHNLKTMITAWRERWAQGDFPFYIAQLANFRGVPSEPLEYDGWAAISDQQRRALSLKNTGMAVLIDIGETKDIHPHNKMDVGTRLALWALKKEYNQDIPAWSGPLYRDHEIKDNKIVITFDHAGSGLMSGRKNGQADTVETKDPLQRFQICGTDRQWKWATADITGKDSVTVSHPDVPKPSVVRYAWAQNPMGANLYNKEGLPASIFTTETIIPPPPDQSIPSKDSKEDK